MNNPLLTAKDLLTAIYTSKEVDECIKRLRQEEFKQDEYRQDLKQYVFVILFETPEEKILDLQRQGRLKHYVAKLIFNTANWRDRSKFYTELGFKETKVSEFDVESAADFQTEEDDGPDLSFMLSVNDGFTKIRRNNKAEQDKKDQVEKIILALDKIYWYKAELFKLYIKLGTYQRVADQTGINVVSIFKTVRQAKKEIKQLIK